MPHIADHPVLFLATAVAAVAGVPPQSREVLRVTVISCINFLETQFSPEMAPATPPITGGSTSAIEDASPTLTPTPYSNSAQRATLFGGNYPSMAEMLSTARTASPACHMWMCMEHWTRMETAMAILLCAVIPTFCACMLTATVLLYMRALPSGKVRTTWNVLQAIQHKCSNSDAAYQQVARVLNLTPAEGTIFVTQLRNLLSSSQDEGASQQTHAST